MQPCCFITLWLFTCRNTTATLQLSRWGYLQWWMVLSLTVVDESSAKWEKSRSAKGKTVVKCLRGLSSMLHGSWANEGDVSCLFLKIIISFVITNYYSHTCAPLESRSRFKWTNQWIKHEELDTMLRADFLCSLQLLNTRCYVSVFMFYKAAHTQQAYFYFLFR